MRRRRVAHGANVDYGTAWAAMSMARVALFWGKEGGVVDGTPPDGPGGVAPRVGQKIVSPSMSPRPRARPHARHQPPPPPPPPCPPRLARCASTFIIRSATNSPTSMCLTISSPVFKSILCPLPAMM